MTGTILILGANTMQLPAIRSAKRLGLRVIVADANERALCRDEADIFEHVDLKDKEEMLAMAASREEPEPWPSPFYTETPSGDHYAHLSGRWRSADGETLVIQGNRFSTLDEDNDIMETGTYTIHGNQLFVQSDIGFNRTVEYTVHGNILTLVTRVFGIPVTDVYERVH